MTPRVSIITPYKDAEAHLAEAIASVLAQHMADWQLVLVDDGSSDSGRAIADAAAAADPRIRSLAQPPTAGSGAAAARNWGVRQAAAELLVFLDADDRLLPDKLAIECAIMDRHPAIGMVCGGTLWWYPAADRPSWSDEIRSLGPGVVAPPVLLDRIILLQRGHVPCLCGVMIRRGALRGADPFERRFQLYEDQSLLVKVALDCAVYVGRHLTAMYRQHPGSTSAQAERDGLYQRVGTHAARADFLAWVRDYVTSRNSPELSTVDALAVAEARQSGDRSALNPRQRRLMRAVVLRRVANKLIRRARRLAARLIGR